MSKEYVRRIVFTRFMNFEGLTASKKSYPNLEKSSSDNKSTWAKLRKIDFVVNKISSIGDEPCTTRTGVIIIEAFGLLNVGIEPLTVLTDKIEDYFGLWTEGDFYTGAANTVDNEDDKSETFRKFTVYIPFTYHPSK